MTIFTTQDNHIINIDYVAILGPIGYNATIEKYYYNIHLAYDNSYIIYSEFDTRELAERNRDSLAEIIARFK